MQPHWIEPAPLGDAQRLSPGGSGLIGSEPHLPAPQYHMPQAPQRRALPFQAAAEAAQGSTSHAAMIGGGFVLALIGGAIGYYIGQQTGKKKATRAIASALGDDDEDEGDDEEEDEDED